MISNVKMRRLFLPLVGVNAFIFNKYALNMYKIGFKVGSKPYKRGILYIITDSVEFEKTMQRVGRLVDTLPHIGNRFILELKTLTTQEKKIWDALIEGNYKVVSKWNLAKYDNIFTAAEAKEVKDMLRGNDDFYINELSKQIKNTTEKSCIERAKDLYYSDKESIKKVIKKPKIQINSI